MTDGFSLSTRQNGKTLTIRIQPPLNAIWVASEIVSGESAGDIVEVSFEMVYALPGAEPRLPALSPGAKSVE